MKTPIKLRQITKTEFHNLTIGDIVFVKVGKHTLQCSVISKPFYNHDADETGWEVETTNGCCDQGSLWVKN